MKKQLRNVAKLIAPILVFPVLFIPYALLNSEVLVKWLGCGCPKIDASGEMIHDYFSANDFTAYFWLVIAICVTVLSGFFSKNVFKKKKWVRAVYVAGMFLISLFAAYFMIQRLMWN